MDNEETGLNLRPGAVLAKVTTGRTKKAVRPAEQHGRCVDQNTRVLGNLSRGFPFFLTNSCCCHSVNKSCLILCNSMDCSTPGPSTNKTESKTERSLMKVLKPPPGRELSVCCSPPSRHEWLLFTGSGRTRPSHWGLWPHLSIKPRNHQSGKATWSSWPRQTFLSCLPFPPFSCLYPRPQETLEVTPAKASNALCQQNAVGTWWHRGLAGIHCPGVRLYICFESEGMEKEVVKSIPRISPDWMGGVCFLFHPSCCWSCLLKGCANMISRLQGH